MPYWKKEKNLLFANSVSGKNWKNIFLNESGLVNVPKWVNIDFGIFFTVLKI